MIAAPRDFSQSDYDAVGRILRAARSPGPLPPDYVYGPDPNAPSTAMINRLRGILPAYQPMMPPQVDRLIAQGLLAQQPTYSSTLVPQGVPQEPIYRVPAQPPPWGGMGPPPRPQLPWWWGKLQPLEPMPYPPPQGPITFPTPNTPGYWD